MPCTAHGKMYKRYTFDNLAPSLGTRTGGTTGQIMFVNYIVEIMKKSENEVKKKMVAMRMNYSDLERLEKFQKQSTEKYLSNYLRKVTLQKLVIIKYLNQSADDFLEDMLELKKELHAIGNNFSQLVKNYSCLKRYRNSGYGYLTTVLYFMVW